MKVIKRKSLTGALLLLFMIGFTGCNDNELPPITLMDREDSNITMYYHGEETSEYAFALHGGDGRYSVRSGNEEVVVAEIVDFSNAVDYSTIHLTPKGIGETIVTITDNSNNTLVLTVQVDYETHSLVVVQHDVHIAGGDLTVNEVNAIREKQLAQIPVKKGGGYKFIFTDAPNGKGIAVIYPQRFGSGGIETTFEYRKFEYGRGYEVTIDNEKRLFVVEEYEPTKLSVRPQQPLVLKEDVTGKVQAEYPEAELVYILQLFTPHHVN